MIRKVIVPKTIQAKKGYVFVKKDKSAVYGNSITLHNYDIESNYIQVTLSEAERLKNELKEDLLNEQQA